MFHFQDIKALYFWPSHDLPDLWNHDEYQYMRQCAFLSISFKPQLIKSPDLVIW